jgi:limonene-1,2-epoxide hydrolase
VSPGKRSRDFLSRKPVRWSGYALALLLMGATCAQASESATAFPSTTAVATSPTPARRATGPSEVVPRLDAQQAEAVRTVIEFIQAYDRADLEAVIALMQDDVAYSDCDYANHTYIAVKGKTAVRDWLRARFADHDRWELGDVTLNNAVLAVALSNRSSDSLQAVGFSSGIKPRGAAKVIFIGHYPLPSYGTGERDLIAYWNGGDAQICDLT